MSFTIKSKFVLLLLAAVIFSLTAVSAWSATGPSLDDPNVDPMKIDDVLSATPMPMDDTLDPWQKAFLQNSRALRLASLITFSADSGGCDYTTFSFGHEGYIIGTQNAYDTISGFPISGADADTFSKYGFHTALTTQRDKEGGLSGAHRFIAVDFSPTGKREIVIGRIKSDGSTGSPNKGIKAVGLKNITLPQQGVYYGAATDVCAGLFIPGEDAESFVIAEVDTRTGGLRLCVVPGAIYDDASAAPFYIEQNRDGALSTYYRNGTANQVRVAAGDFDGDGVRSEIALANVDKTGRYSRIDVFRITSRGTYTEVFSDSINPSGADLDVAAGDFDGDGRGEAALVTVGGINIYGPDGGGGVKLLRNASFVGSISPLAETYDIDGDGKQELVVAALGNNNNLIVSIYGVNSAGALERWSMANLITPTKLFGSLQSSASLALAPLIGRRNSATGTTYPDLVMSLQTYDDKSKQAVNSGVYVWIYDGDGQKNFVIDPKWKTIARGGSTLSSMLTGDFARESIVLGPPQHFVYRAYTNFMTIISAIPYHVDYIWLPSKVTDASVMPKKDIQKLSYNDSLATTFTHSETSGKSEDLKAQASLGFAIDASASATEKIPLVAELDEKVSASLGLKGALDVMAEITETTATMTSKTVSLFDGLIISEADFHIWRYPVVGSAVDPDDPVLDGKSFDISDRTTYVTYVLPFGTYTRYTDSTRDVDYYSPHGEEGNLFSYPVTKEQIPGYTAGGVLSGGNERVDAGSNHTQSIKWTDSINKEGGIDLSGTLKASVSMTAKAKVPLIASGSATITESLEASLKASASFGTSYSKEDSFSFSLPTLETEALNASKYSVWPVIFAEEDSGTTQMSYAVQLDTINSTQRESLWRSDVSPYKMYPDPALNLPGKWSTTKSDMSQFIQFVASGVDTATRIRGLNIIDSEGNNAGRLVSPGETYTIQVPISNYSLAPAPSFDVAFQYNKGYSGITLTDKTEIGRRVTVAGLSGWDGTHDTRQIVEYKWTVPTAAENPDFTNGSNLRLYVEIDPDDNLQEVHEAWTKDDPAGNNVGYVEFSVSTGGAETFSTISVNGKKIQAAPVSKSRVAAVTASDFKAAFTNVTKDDIRAAIRNGESLLVEGTLTYTGDKPVTHFEVIVEETPKVGEPTHLLAAKTIPLIMPQESRKFSFMLRGGNLEGEELFIYIKSAEMGRVLVGDFNIKDDGNGQDNGGGSSGGCDAGGGALSLAIFALAIAAGKKRW
jgi:hypothetical protein